MSALFCLFLWFRSYYEKLQEYIPTFYKIRYILEELYVAVMWIISRLIIYIDQLNTATVNKLLNTKSLLTTPSNVSPLHLKQILSIIWIFTEVEGDRIEYRLHFKIFSTLPDTKEKPKLEIELQGLLSWIILDY